MNLYQIYKNVRFARAFVRFLFRKGGAQNLFWFVKTGYIVLGFSFICIIEVALLYFHVAILFFFMLCALIFPPSLPYGLSSFRPLKQSLMSYGVLPRGVGNNLFKHFSCHHFNHSLILCTICWKALLASIRLKVLQKNIQICTIVTSLQPWC